MTKRIKPREPDNTTTNCPGCGATLAKPYAAGDSIGRSWLDRGAWCHNCGGTADTR